MSVIIILIIIGVLVAGGFLAGFIWAVRSGQYDDTDSPAVRMLFDNAISGGKKDDDNSGIHSEKEDIKQKNNNKPMSN